MEIERAGIPTVLVTALPDVGLRIGANRIVVAGGRFHCPFGQPELPVPAEQRWRMEFTRAALNGLLRAVDGPTVFTVDQLANVS